MLKTMLMMLTDVNCSILAANTENKKNPKIKQKKQIKSRPFLYFCISVFLYFCMSSFFLAFFLSLFVCLFVCFFL